MKSQYSLKQEKALFFKARESFLFSSKKKFSFFKQEKVFFFQARESFLYIRHGLASVGANNVFANCVLANCEKRSLLGNCQPSVNREGSCASLWWRWSCLDRSEPGGDRAPLTHRHPHTMRITPSSSRQNIFIVPSMLLSTWLVGPGQHLQTFYKEIWHLQKKNTNHLYS